MPFFQGPHDLETLDRRIGCFQALETTHRFDQLLEFAVIGIDHIVQIFHLTVLHRVRKLTLFLEFPNRGPIGRSLVCVDGFRFLPFFKAI